MVKAGIEPRSTTLQANALATGRMRRYSAETHSMLTMGRGLLPNVPATHSIAKGQICFHSCTCCHTRLTGLAHQTHLHSPTARMNNASSRDKLLLLTLQSVLLIMSHTSKPVCIDNCATEITVQSWLNGWLERKFPSHPVTIY